ncbi:MAG: vitamin B12 dependent-methionine synthase activation domain-containing protein [Halanaerobiales bacterium]
MQILNNIPFDMDRENFYKKINIDNYSEDLKLQVDSFIQEVESKIRPKAIYKESYIESKVDNKVTVEEVTFESSILTDTLNNIERIFPFIATCGNELEELQQNTDDYLKQFWIDKFKEMSLAAATSYLYNHIVDKYKIEKISSMNPGSADKEVWPLSEQKKLFLLFGDVEEKIGVNLTDSYLMIPNKSVSGIYFPADESFINCEYCTREDCPSRRAPHNPAKW